MTVFYNRRVPPFGYLRVNAFFRLTEAYRRFRALLRLSMPRHPPAALNSLTIKYVQALSCNLYILKRQLFSQSITSCSLLHEQRPIFFYLILLLTNILSR